MRTTRRRKRQPDPLASAAAVRAVFDELRRRLPEIIPTDEKRLASLLRAAIWAERSRAGSSPRGRRSRWPPRDLARVAAALRDILGRGTSSRKDARSFVDHYLRLLSFPADVLEALERGEVNLFEAEQLARVTPKALGLSSSSARTRRRQLLRAHLAAQQSGQRLRMRVNALLNSDSAEEADLPSPQVSHEILAAAAQLEAELAGASDEVEPDPTHLFYELLASIAHALGKLEPDDLTEEVQKQLFSHGDAILLVLQKLERQRAAPGR